MLPTDTTSALLYLNGVHVAFDGFKAINNLSLAIEPGEMRAIIGPNGAGKTTMMDIITGKTKPDTGDVFFDGGKVDLTLLDETRIAELGIGRKFQKPTVFESQTVEDNLLLALNVDHRVRGTLFWRETKRRDRDHRARAGDDPAEGCARARWPAASRTGRSSGSRSACCWRRIRNCCWSTSRSPA